MNDGGVNLFSRIYPFCYLYVTPFSKEDQGKGIHVPITTPSITGFF
jgi:hypothetical protein